MIDDTISFTPEDFDSVLTIEELSNYIAIIIQQIRQNSIALPILADIQEMQKIAQKGLSTESDISELLHAYKMIQSVSMKLRAELKQFINLDTYDNIAYAFYYDGKRFATESLSMTWLFKTNKGELRLSLDKATQDLSKEIQSTAQQKILDIFNKHYMSYLNAISGMYKYPLGAKVKGAKLNKGHVAEAYEIHISEHHTQAYQLLNTINNPNSVMDKMIYAFELETKGDEYWAKHEDPTSAWIHIRNAMGTQRGTVAGDVGRFQVKQGSTSTTNIYSSQVRLASLSTLKNGVKIYSDIINLDIPVEVVAKKIAMYISEPVAQNERNLQAYVANKHIANEISKLGKLRHV